MPTTAEYVLKPIRDDGEFSVSVVKNAFETLELYGRSQLLGSSCCGERAQGEQQRADRDHRLSDPALLPSPAGTAQLGETYAGWISADGSAFQTLYVGPQYNSSGQGLVLGPSGNLVTVGAAGSVWTRMKAGQAQLRKHHGRIKFQNLTKPLLSTLFSPCGR